MKLEEGMYARIDGKIGKVVHICKCEQCEVRGYYEPIIEYAHGEKDYVSVYWKDNLKASHNIIDLIEVGDYVNGLYIDQLPQNPEYKLIWHLSTYGEDDEVFKEEDIKSIVTKEQFESMSYKV